MSRRGIFHGPSVVYIGDAAHGESLFIFSSKGLFSFFSPRVLGMSPQLGQGANMALLDSSILSECLLDCNTVRNPASVACALSKFSQRRQSQLAFYQMVSRLLTPVFQSHSATLGVTRDLFTGPLTQRVPFIRQQALLSLAGMKTSLFGELELDPYLKMFGQSPFRGENSVG